MSMLSKEDISKHYLMSSNLFASDQPYLIDTLLGSCVAVCLWDSHLKIGGVNHYMLPLWNGEGLASPKYGNIAIEKLLEKMLSLGSRQSRLVAKLFGGAHQFDQGDLTIQIGDRNISVAHSMLNDLRIPVISSDLGGEKGRKIRFYTITGEVWMKYL